MKFFIRTAWRTGIVYVHERTPGVEVIVVEGFLPNRSRETGCKSAAGIVFSPKRANQRWSRLHSRMPRFQNCGDILVRPVEHQRTSAKDDQHDRLAGCRNCLKEFLLVAR